MSLMHTTLRGHAAEQQYRRQPAQELRPAGETPARGGVQQANGTDSRLSAASAAADHRRSADRQRLRPNAHNHNEEPTRDSTTPNRETEGGETSYHGGQNTTNNDPRTSTAAPASPPPAPARDPHPPRQSVLFSPPRLHIAGQSFLTPDVHSVPGPPLFPRDHSPLETLAGMHALPPLTYVPGTPPAVKAPRLPNDKPSRR
ncbi:hypothetical protein PsYK624_083290 [Phanerochaete sordida]|uniref:Uncharacterized protein n=1 Tax=Phanerochaete sordida TaxID=48140 RepID=A0A9P3GCD8_9APHY|nr:hypothetical protein PsYK624_083290 [Phanerochaete sordida]